MNFKSEKINLGQMNYLTKNGNLEGERKKAAANLCLTKERYLLYKTFVHAESAQALAYKKSEEERVKNENSIKSNIELLLNDFDKKKLEKLNKIIEIERNAEVREKYAKPDNSSINKDDPEETLEKLRHTYAATTDLLQYENIRSSNHKEKAAQLMQEIEALKQSVEIIEDTNREMESKKEGLEVTRNTLQFQIDGMNNIKKKGVNFNDFGACNGNGEDLSTVLPAGESRSNEVELTSLGDCLESLFDEVNAPHGDVEQYYCRMKKKYLETRDDIKRIKGEIKKLDDDQCKMKASLLRRQKERAKIAEERDTLCNEIIQDFDVAIQTIENFEPELGSNPDKNTEHLCENPVQCTNNYKDEISKLEMILKSNEYLSFKISQKKTHIDIDLGITERRIRNLKEIHQTLRKNIADISVLVNIDTQSPRDSSK